MMKIIDFEHHSYPQDFYDALAKRKTAPKYETEKQFLYYKEGMGPLTLGSMLDGKHSVAEQLSDYETIRIQDMDDSGLKMGMLSSGHGIEELPRDESIRQAKLMNDTVAETVKHHPDRFIGAFCLPTPYVDAALEELDRAVNELGLKMWQTHSNYGKESLYLEKFEPILAKCAELNVPFYVHPNSPEIPELLTGGSTLGTAALGFGVDVMNTTMRIIMNGTFDRYPNLKMVIGHMGEYYPYVVDRIDNRFMPGDSFIKMKHTYRYYFEHKNIFLTTSGVTSVPSFMCARETIGIEKILFGSDYPYELLKPQVDFLNSLPISDAEKEMVAHGNAEKYLL